MNHNCDGKIGEFLSYSPNPFDDAKPAWFVVVYKYDPRDKFGVPSTFYPIRYCPVCGVELSKLKGESE